MVAGRMIVVGNEKGGTGKTTISVNLAAMAACRGLDVLLIDADRQQSASKWVARRREDWPSAPRITSVIMSGRAIAPDIERMLSQYPLVIVDTGASDSVELRVAAAAANVMVIPVGPGGGDLWSLPTMGALVKAAKRLNPGLRVTLAINRIPPSWTRHAEADVTAWSAEHAPELPVSNSAAMVSRNSIMRSLTEGLGIGELPRPDSKAVAEIQNLYKKVMRK